MIMIMGFLLSIRNIINSVHNPEIYNINHHRINNSPLTLEHIFPKCYMNKKTYHDMHNLFKCNKELNNYRSNYKFSDFDNLNIEMNFNDFKKISETDNYVSTKHKIFIPEKESRGIISRAIMYMAFEYKYKYNKVINNDVLIEWCLKHPPTKEEIYHNNIVFMKQYKRNIFIDLYNKKNYKSYISKLFL